MKRLVLGAMMLAGSLMSGYSQSCLPEEDRKVHFISPAPGDVIIGENLVVSFEVEQGVHSTQLHLQHHAVGEVAPGGYDYYLPFGVEKPNDHEDDATYYREWGIGTHQIVIPLDSINREGAMKLKLNASDYIPQNEEPYCFQWDVAISGQFYFWKDYPLAFQDTARFIFAIEEEIETVVSVPDTISMLEIEMETEEDVWTTIDIFETTEGINKFSWAHGLDAVDTIRIRINAGDDYIYEEYFLDAFEASVSFTLKDTLDLTKETVAGYVIDDQPSTEVKVLVSTDGGEFIEVFSGYTWENSNKIALGKGLKAFGDDVLVKVVELRAGKEIFIGEYETVVLAPELNFFGLEAGNEYLVEQAPHSIGYTADMGYEAAHVNVILQDQEGTKQVVIEDDYIGQWEFIFNADFMAGNQYHYAIEFLDFPLIDAVESDVFEVVASEISLVEFAEDTIIYNINPNHVFEVVNTYGSTSDVSLSLWSADMQDSIMTLLSGEKLEQGLNKIDWNPEALEGEFVLALYENGELLEYSNVFELVIPELVVGSSIEEMGQFSLKSDFVLWFESETNLVDEYEFKVEFVQNNQVVTQATVVIGDIYEGEEVYITSDEFGYLWPQVTGDYTMVYKINGLVVGESSSFSYGTNNYEMYNPSSWSTVSSEVSVQFNFSNLQYTGISTSIDMAYSTDFGATWTTFASEHPVTESALLWEDLIEGEYILIKSYDSENPTDVGNTIVKGMTVIGGTEYDIVSISPNPYIINVSDFLEVEIDFRGVGTESFAYTLRDQTGAPIADLGEYFVTPNDVANGQIILSISADKLTSTGFVFITLDNLVSGDIMEQSPVFSIEIEKIATSVVWEQDTWFITSGYEISAEDLNAEGSVDGTIVYSSSIDGLLTIGSELSEGVHTITATFLPEDDLNYNSSTTSIEAYVSPVTNLASESKGISIYPIPATDVLNVSGAEGEVSIYDVLGTVLYQGTDSSIDVSSFGTGLYFVKAGGELHSIMIE